MKTSENSKTMPIPPPMPQGMPPMPPPMPPQMPPQMPQGMPPMPPQMPPMIQGMPQAQMAYGGPVLMARGGSAPGDMWRKPNQMARTNANANSNFLQQQQAVMDQSRMAMDQQRVMSPYQYGSGPMPTNTLSGSSPYQSLLNDAQDAFNSDPMLREYQAPTMLGGALESFAAPEREYSAYPTLDASGAMADFGMAGYPTLSPTVQAPTMDGAYATGYQAPMSAMTPSLSPYQPYGGGMTTMPAPTSPYNSLGMPPPPQPMQQQPPGNATGKGGGQGQGMNNMNQNAMGRAGQGGGKGGQSGGYSRPQPRGGYGGGKGG